MNTVGRYALGGAVAAALATALVGGAGLLGATSIPVAELLLFPGSMVAWVLRGDDFASAHEFLIYSMTFGVPLNAVAGAALGGLFAVLRLR